MSPAEIQACRQVLDDWGYQPRQLTLSDRNARNYSRINNPAASAMLLEWGPRAGHWFVGHREGDGAAALRNALRCVEREESERRQHEARRARLSHPAADIHSETMETSG